LAHRLTASTIAHYDSHARSFWEGTKDHDVAQNYAALLDAIEGVPPFAILDFGCRRPAARARRAPCRAEAARRAVLVQSARQRRGGAQRGALRLLLDARDLAEIRERRRIRGAEILFPPGRPAARSCERSEA
jgi:hypothetical protein